MRKLLWRSVEHAAWAHYGLAPVLTLVLAASVSASASVSVVVSASASAASSAASSARWGWPLAPPHSISRTYIAPATPYSAGHRGVDIVGVAGSAVFAPANGVVSFAGVVVDRPVVSVRHPDGVVSSYEPVSTTLTAGTTITRGDVIGTLQPGHCTEPCLHFGTRLFGEYVSPLGFLGSIGHSVLLPTRKLSLTG